MLPIAAPWRVTSPLVYFCFAALFCASSCSFFSILRAFRSALSFVIPADIGFLMRSWRLREGIRQG